MTGAFWRPRPTQGSTSNPPGRAALYQTPFALTLVGGLLALAVLAASLAARAHPSARPNLPAFTRFESRPDQALLALAERLEAGRRPRLGGRTEGWSVIDLNAAPTLGLGPLTQEEAEAVNAWLPASGEAPAAVAPFFLRASGAERDRAILCLTQAIYYEAALEPTAGQEAVAQAVINRVRNPGFPKSICGVVYEGSTQVTGCQFSFTCDGSRDRPPVSAFWNRARQVAEQAVDGFVMETVGTATHYHADYVFPRWGPTLVKIGQIGAHIFYRFPGPAGQPASFHVTYAGNELKVSMAGPSPEAILAARTDSDAAAEALAATGIAGTYAVDAAATPVGQGNRVAGQIVAGQMLIGHRTPTREEVSRINASLAAMEHAAPPAPAAPAAPSGDAPIAHQTWAEN